MKFTVNYIPLNKIKIDEKVPITDRLKKLRRYMLDCMHVMVVKKNMKEDHYHLVYGKNHYQYLQKYSSKKYAPCIVDESDKKGLKAWFQQLRNPTFMDFPLRPTSWSIVRGFLKEDPRFEQLSLVEKWKVILIAVRYKRTVIQSMKSKVDEYKK